MKINNNEINTIKINNKIVESIKRLSDNEIIYRAFDGLLLTEETGKTILSRADNDAAYFEVQLTKNDNPVPLEDIEVELYQVSPYDIDDVVLIDSSLTDSDGKVDFTYSASGTGDISFQAKVSIFSSETYEISSETYEIEDCYKVFKLDGTESIGTFRRGSITCSNGVLSGKSGYVTGFENTESWVLSFDVYHTGYSIIPLVPDTVSWYDDNYVQLMSYLRIFEDGMYRDIYYDSGATKKYSEWQNVKIVKEGNEQYTLYFDDVFAATFTLAWYASQFGVGFDAWSGSNSGQIKNIKVKPIY